MDNAAKPCYDMRALHRNLDLMTTLIGYMQELGWEPYAADHEDANCQFEINWKYADALTTCDRQTFFKWMVKILAEEHGLLATFMPKPFANLTGNGSHCHLSLADPGARRISSTARTISWPLAGGPLVHGRHSEACAGAQRDTGSDGE